MKKFENRPVIHYSVKKNWLNDPNGLFYKDGVYHMFYQYHPYSTNWGPMFWGHVTSEDLIKWEEHQVALSPDKNGTCFSGSAVLDKNNSSGLFENNEGIILMFTSAKLAFMHGGDNLQTQSIAYSKDNGNTWNMYEGNPVIKNQGIADFRDPKLFWYEPNKKWIMVLAADYKVEFYESCDMINWQKFFEFGEKTGCHEHVWECPEFISFNIDGEELWILKVSIQAGSPAGGSGEMYFIGKFDGKEFVELKENNYKWVDGGRDFYASQSWSNTGDRKILIGWMANFRYVSHIPTSEEWRGVMSTPRELSLIKKNNDYILAQKVVNEVYNYRINRENKERIVIENSEESIDIKDGNQDIYFEFITPKENRIEIELNNKNGEKLILIFDVMGEKIHFIRDQYIFVEKGSKSHHTGELRNHTFGNYQTNDYEFYEKNNVRIILDGCTCEIFINNGEKVMTNFIFQEYSFDKMKINSNQRIEINNFEIYDVI